MSRDTPAPLCGVCGEALVPDAVVYRAFRYGEMRVHGACCGGPHDPAWWYPPRPCQGCGRAVAYRRLYTPSPRTFLRDGPDPARVYCGPRCQYQAALARRRAARVPAPRPCPVCSALLTSARRDARYCSARCRQRAHRAALAT